ncbi:Transmembrane protein 8A [Chelonia mydas]|uniref:Transmembrane protein 8A n=1 Tax=Chelonia mydas TaxID=8469 RepID=M7AMR1_CHEMY|nr:Transmembrane protein 8A [Chelonia mydas]
MSCSGNSVAAPLLFPPQRLLGGSGNSAATAWGSKIDLVYISEYFSQSAQKLSFYSWYGNAKLFRFQVPEDTVLLRWLLQASKGKGPECTSMDITMYV